MRMDKMGLDRSRGNGGGIECKNRTIPRSTQLPASVRLLSDVTMRIDFRRLSARTFSARLQIK